MKTGPSSTFQKFFLKVKSQPKNFAQPRGYYLFQASTVPVFHRIWTGVENYTSEGSGPELIKFYPQIFHLFESKYGYFSSFSILIGFKIRISCFLKFLFIILLNKFRLIFSICKINLLQHLFLSIQSYIRKDKYFPRFQVLLTSFIY